MISAIFGRSPREARTIENPNTPLNDPDDWLVDVMGGGPASSGAKVNPSTAMSYAPFYRGVVLIARSVAKIPIQVYRREGPGKERDKEHPAYRLLHQKPNAYQTAFVWKERAQAEVINRGNSYAYIYRDQGGRPIDIVPLVVEKTFPVIEDGALWYVTDVAGKMRKLSAGDVIHLRNLGDGILGKSVVAYAKESLGIGIAAQTYAAVYYKNGARPSIVLEHPATLTLEAGNRLRETWPKMHSGLDNFHKFAILEEGMKLNPYSPSNEDSQFLETRGFQVREAANWLGLPPHKLGDTTRTAYASLEQENQSFLDDSLDPWLCLWEGELGDKLLTEEEKEADTHLIEFNRNALARANMGDRFEAYGSALTNGWMNRDEVRARENLNPIPGGEGQKFMVPLNMGIAGEGDDEGEEEPAAPPPPPEEDEDDQEDEAARAQRALELAAAAGASQAEREARVTAAHRALLIELVQRSAKRITAGGRKAARAPSGYMPWLEGLQAEVAATLTEAARPAVEAWASTRGGPGDPGRLAEILIRRAGETLLEAADAQPADLGRSVARACERVETVLPAVVVDEFMREETTHGT